METEILATELLREIKASARRWFILSMVELLVIAILLIFLFVIPVETCTETEYQQEITDITDSSTITQNIGDNYGDNETNSN